MDDTAFKMIRLANSGYCCTQIMIKMVLDEEDKENNDLVKAVNGLCKGIGGCQKTCGVLTGGIVIIGLYAGKGEDIQFPSENYGKMNNEYIKWFEEEFKSMECMDIIGVYSFNGENPNENYMLKCGDILLKSYEKIQQILYKYGYEFGSRD